MMCISRWTAARLGGYMLLLALLAIMAGSLGLRWSNGLDLQFSWPLLALDLLFSLARTAVACLLAWSAACMLGYLLWSHPLVDRLFLPLVNFVRAVPPLAWLPFAIIWFGLGEAPVFFILLIALFFPSLIAARDAYQQIDRDYIDEARVLGAVRWRLFAQVMLPLALPALLTLLRIVWALGWGTVVAAEMLGVHSGMGFRLLDFRYLVQYPHMLIYLVVMGLVGIGVDRVLRRLASWAADPLLAPRAGSILPPFMRLPKGQP
jgi:NitT/TauT family transport system permease protein